MDFLHEFYLRDNDRQFIINRFDPNRYSYLNLVDDIDKWVLANLLLALVILLNVEYLIVASTYLAHDVDVQKMFRLYILVELILF